MIFFFLWSEFELEPYIYYESSLPTELSSQGRWFYDLKTFSRALTNKICYRSMLQTVHSYLFILFLKQYLFTFNKHIHSSLKKHINSCSQKKTITRQTYLRVISKDIFF